MAALAAIAGVVAAAKAKPKGPPAGTSSVLGIVYDGLTGNRIPGVSVRLEGLETYTDIDGVFRFNRIGAGRYTVSFTHQDYEPLSLKIILTEGQEKHLGEIALTPIAPQVTTSTLFGQVTDASTGIGIPTPWVSLDSIISDHGDYYGNYRIFDIPPGSYIVTFSRDGYESQTRSVILSKRKITELNVSLTPTEQLISLSELSIIPSKPALGDTVYIRCRATNHSPVGATLSRHVDLLIDGTVVASWDLTLAWAETVFLEHPLIAAGIGEHVVEFDGLVGMFEVLAAPPVSLFIPETRKLIFDGKSLYSALHYPDPDIDWQNRAAEAAEFVLSKCNLSITQEVFPIYQGSPLTVLWTLEGNWQALSRYIVNISPLLRVYNEYEYNNNPVTQARVGSPVLGYGLEFFYEKVVEFILTQGYYEMSSPDRPYIAIMEWPLYSSTTTMLSPTVADSIKARQSSGVLAFIAEGTFGYRAFTWPFTWVSPPRGSYVVVLQINVTLETVQKYTLPLYVCRIGKFSF